MKRLLLACMCLLFCVGSWAKGITIQLRVNHEHREIHKRSMSVAPVAIHNSETIYIYFPGFTTESQITVKDAIGTILYVEVITVPTEHHTLMFNIGNNVSTNEEFLLEIKTGVQIYYGYFFI